MTQRHRADVLPDIEAFEIEATAPSAVAQRDSLIFAGIALVLFTIIALAAMLSQ